jgi:hypothetical protein
MLVRSGISFDHQSPTNYGWEWITFYSTSNTIHAH